MSENLHIGIVSGKKLTDALLCNVILKKFPNTTVIQYQIPIKMWFSWIIKRIHKMGIVILIGHILLSIYLRAQRRIELLFQRSLWLRYIKFSPSWDRIPNKTSYLSEKKLIEKMRKVDIVILTGQFRLSHNFYRKIKVPCLELVWGNVPDYMGDSAGFWAFATNDRKQVGITIIERFSQYNKIKIIQHASVVLDDQENLRTIKIKQAIKMAEIVPEAILHFLKNYGTENYSEKETICRLFQAPTLFTYLSFLKFAKMKNLPKYSHAKTNCTLMQLK